VCCLTCTLKRRDEVEQGDEEIDYGAQGLASGKSTLFRTQTQYTSTLL
jgi:hypothetical protein